VSSYAASLRALAKVFGNPHVRSLQLAGAGSILGTYAYAVALPIYAYHSGGARTVGLVFFARFVFAALAAPWLGVLADRWSRRQLMLGGDLVRCAIFAGMTSVAAGGGSPYIVYVLAVTSTVVSGSYSPAQAALLPSLVRTPDELTAANLVGNTISSLGMFVGPALGGILLAVSTPAAVFALNGALFLWSAFFVVRVPRDEPPERAERSKFLPEVTAGWTTMWRTPALRVVIGLTTGDAFVFGALEVLLVVLALRILHSGNAGYGWLNTGMGVGSVAGAFIVAAIAARRRLAGGFGLGILLSGVGLCVSATLSTLAPALILLGLVGTATILIEVTSVTLLQRSAENEVLGRVFALYETLALAGTAIGAVVAPALVTWLGARGALIAIGAFLPVVLVPLWPSLQRIDAEAQIAYEPLELLRRIEMFAQLPEPVLEHLAAVATAVSVAPDQVVVSRGEAGRHFYVIGTGRALVELDAGATRELGPGDFFGEIALLRDVPRTATVRALAQLQLYSVERDEFIAAVTGHAQTLAAAESVIGSRLAIGALG
jgi:MFS family permease